MKKHKITQLLRLNSLSNNVGEEVGVSFELEFKKFLDVTN